MVAVAVLIAILLVGLVLKQAFASTVKSASARLNDRAATVEALGFTYEAKGSTEFRRSFSDVPGIPDSGKAKHVLRGTVAGRSAAAFEHTYMVYNGSTVMPVSHVVYSTGAPAWPKTTIVPRNVLSRLALRFGWESGLLLEHADFNRLFRVKASDEDFALTLLSPEMQQFLVGKSGVTWHITPGRLCLVYNGSMRFGRVEQSLNRLEGFWARVPEELEHWDT